MTHATSPLLHLSMDAHTLKFEPQYFRGVDKRSLWLTVVLSASTLLLSLTFGHTDAAIVFGSLLWSVVPAHLAILFFLRSPRRQISPLTAYLCLLTLTAMATTLSVLVYLHWGDRALIITLGEWNIVLLFLSFSFWVVGSELWLTHARQQRALERRRTEETLQLEHALLIAELKALQAQIEPHFLFNTLANLQALISLDAARAQSMLEQLISYLRACIPRRGQTMTSVGQDFLLLAHYLALIAFRFGARFTYSLTLDESLKQAELPPLMLLTLIENAVKHGIEPKTGAVHISVEASQCGDTILCRVCDNGVGLHDTGESNGLGLANIRERLQRFYGDSSSLRLYAQKEGGACAEIRVPLSVSTLP